MRRREHAWTVGGVASVVVLLIGVIAAGRASAAGQWYVANTGDDANDCLSPSTPCATINAAIGKALAGDAILVAMGTYYGSAAEVVLLDKDVELSGGWDASFASQSGASIIDGQGARRGVTLEAATNAALDSFALQNGQADSGGGLYNAGIASVSNCVFDGNTAAGPAFDNAGGGGIFNSGTLTLIESTVSNNTAELAGADVGGGGIFNSGTLHVVNSSIEHNISLSTRGGGGILNLGSVTALNSIVLENYSDGHGGGAENVGALATFDATNTTFQGNAAVVGAGIDLNSGTVVLNSSLVSINTASLPGGAAGGIFVENGALIVNNSTVSDNVADYGGGIQLVGSGSVVLNNSTVVANLTTPGGIVPNGGGVQNLNNQGTITLRNSLVAKNIGRDSPNCAGNILSAGYNVLGNSTGCSFASAVGDLTDVDPLVGILEDNAGPTLTHALFSGSPAIDAGNPAGCTDHDGNLLAGDQRGIPRPQGPNCDAGAYEFEAVGNLFRGGMTGRSEVPPVTTMARGNLRLGLDSPGTRLGFELNLADIVEATDGHVHCDLAGENGPVGVTLFSGASFSGSGTLRGVITVPDAGNGCGWVDLADVVYALRVGHAYSNVHTVGNPSGEIRGQITPVTPP